MSPTGHQTAFTGAATDALPALAGRASGVIRLRCNYRRQFVLRTLLPALAAAVLLGMVFWVGCCQ